MTKGEKEEIIDLTEVVEESSISGEKENQGVSAKAEDQARGGKGLPEEAWPSRPEVESPLRIAVTPEEKPAPETEQNAPMDVPRTVESPKPVFADSESAVQALREALSAKAEKWLTVEGQQILDQGAREMIPRIAAEALGKEIEKMRAEVEKIGVQKEALRGKIEEWMAADGIRVIERVAREMFPVIATEVLRQEIEKLKAEAEEKA